VSIDLLRRMVRQFCFMSQWLQSQKLPSPLLSFMCGKYSKLTSSLTATSTISVNGSSFADEFSQQKICLLCLYV
jgi:hypothetical protein